MYCKHNIVTLILDLDQKLEYFVGNLLLHKCQMTKHFKMSSSNIELDILYNFIICNLIKFDRKSRFLINYFFRY